MHIDVIGGSGFIGTRLCMRIKAAGEHSFSIIDKRPSECFPALVRIADVRSVDNLRSAVKPRSVIVNLAAEHRDDVSPVSLYDEVNVGGARNVCQIASELDISVIVFTSSVAVYGFAPIGTDETGSIAPFNDYGRTKFEAEKIYCAWQREAPSRRSLVVIRPTVVFGERNRGNVYNLIKFISSRSFVMVGSGQNRKSIAYVENVAAFIEHSLSFGPGIHLFNYVDKPDFTMNDLVSRVRILFGKSRRFGVRLPYRVGFLIGRAFDVVAAASGLRFAISSIRVRKFCSDSVYGTSVGVSGFEPPVALEEALERTVRRDFIDSDSQETAVFYTE